MMKKHLFLFVLGLLSVFLTFESSLAWQGRMAGMGDPYGLVQDESDMLIHPAMIMNSSGTRFYTHYRFTYTDVMDWDYKWGFDAGALELSNDFKASGDEYKHEALIGSSFNLGSGRMGIFFTYENLNGGYDGEIDSFLFGPNDMDFDLDADKTDFTLSLVFGFPIDSIDIGFEAGFAYRNEENKTSQERFGFDSTNPLFVPTIFPLFIWSNIYTYMIPYDSEYYESFLKASIASELGRNADFGLTLKGSYIFSGDNELYSKDDVFVSRAKMDGDVEGWSLGGDFWLRYKVDDSFSLPFLVSAGIQKKVRDGADDTTFAGIPADFYYEHKEVNWNVEAGGGIDIALNDTSNIASSIYYRYFENNNEFMVDIRLPGGSFDFDMDDVPDYDEHRITLRLAYEKEFSPTVDFRAGFDCFCGWADWGHKNDIPIPNFKESVSMDGGLWGIGLTLGSTIKVAPVTLEPFIGIAYQATDLEGDGRSNNLPDFDGDHERDQWLVTIGLSILF